MPPSEPPWHGGEEPPPSAPDTHVSPVDDAGGAACVIHEQVANV